MSEGIIKEIENLKVEKDAVILAHYYAPAEAQSIADYVGDSYYLAKVATKLEQKRVVFCGVNFMGESVKILNPEKTVLMPDITADCPMAHMASVDKINELKELYKDLSVVCYINSTAALKCASDVCVTSSNAIDIVKKLDSKNIFFIPDRNLGRFVAEQVPEKNIILNDGCCPIHAALTKKDVLRVKSEHPDALVLTHPECEKEIIELSDYIGSTAEILSFANKSDAKEFIICTEEGVGFPLAEQNKDKQFYFAKSSFICKDMKLNTLENILKVLKNDTNKVEVDESIRKRALIPLDKMLEMAK